MTYDTAIYWARTTMASIVHIVENNLREIELSWLQSSPKHYPKWGFLWSLLSEEHMKNYILWKQGRKLEKNGENFRYSNMYKHIPSSQWQLKVIAECNMIIVLQFFCFQCARKQNTDWIISVFYFLWQLFNFYRWKHPGFGGILQTILSRRELDRNI